MIQNPDLQTGASRRPLLGEQGAKIRESHKTRMFSRHPPSPCANRARLMRIGTFHPPSEASFPPYRLHQVGCNHAN